jgi:hypothetical protein
MEQLSIKFGERKPRMIDQKIGAYMNRHPVRWRKYSVDPDHEYSWILNVKRGKNHDEKVIKVPKGTHTIYEFVFMDHEGEEDKIAQIIRGDETRYLQKDDKWGNRKEELQTFSEVYNSKAVDLELVLGLWPEKGRLARIGPR